MEKQNINKVLKDLRIILLKIDAVRDEVLDLKNLVENWESELPSEDDNEM